MMNIRITTDSSADIPQKYVEKYHIGVAPLYIVIGDHSFKDGIEIDTFRLFEELKKESSMATTSAVSEHDFTELFSSIKKENPETEVVHIGISEKISVSTTNARSAARNFSGVYVVDAESVTMGTGLLVLKACEMAEAGMSAKEIYETLLKQVPLIRMTCILDTLTYVRRGGRISTVAALGAEIFNVKPMIEAKNGLLGVGKKYRGKLEKVLGKYVDDLLKDQKNIDLSRAFIINTLFDKEIARAVEKQVRALQPFEEVVISDAGCTISCHAGPNGLGVLFMRKE